MYILKYDQIEMEIFSSIYFKRLIHCFARIVHVSDGSLIRCRSSLAAFRTIAPAIAASSHS